MWSALGAATSTNKNDHNVPRMRQLFGSCSSAEPRTTKIGCNRARPRVAATSHFRLATAIRLPRLLPQRWGTEPWLALLFGLVSGLLIGGAVGRSHRTPSPIDDCDLHML